MSFLYTRSLSRARWRQPNALIHLGALSHRFILPVAIQSMRRQRNLYISHMCHGEKEDRQRTVEDEKLPSLDRQRWCSARFTCPFQALLLHVCTSRLGSTMMLTGGTKKAVSDGASAWSNFTQSFTYYGVRSST